MNTKKLALIAIFTALTIVLGQIIKIPFPALPFLYFQLWEIPILVAFLVIGPIAGIFISLFNAVVLFAIFPGELPAGPLYNLIAILSMMAGVYIVELIVKQLAKRKQTSQNALEYKPKWISASTAMGIVIRVIAMAIMWYFLIPAPYPFGYGSFGITIPMTIAMIPLGALFNAIVALYTIPTAYLIANVIKRSLKFDTTTTPSLSKNSQEKEAKKN
jgi:riboflavin transporter FmnP